MSLRSDGTYHCDRCGVLLPGTNVTKCAVIVDMNPLKPGQSRQLHLCRVNSCAPTVLTDEALADWVAVNTQ